MKELFKFILSNLGINAGLATKKEEVLHFITSLWPRKTNHNLIRLGPNGDGGYLVPDDLENISACFSPGVDLISEFEFDCYQRGMQIYLADKSVDNPNLNIPEDNYTFLKKFIGTINNEDFITIDSWVNSVDIDVGSDLLLQMDIEGHEYSSILTMSDEVVNKFRIMVIEFHDLHKIWNKEFFRLVKSVFLKILNTHICVHIHPNNECGIDSQKGVEIPRVAEFTFLRKDRLKLSEYATQFPHNFDFDNTGKKSIVLP